LITFIFPISLTIYQIRNESQPPFALVILAAVFHTLQGLFNFIVFIYPKVIFARHIETNLTLLQALMVALKSDQGETNRARLIEQRQRNRRGLRQRSHNSMIVEDMNQVVRAEEEVNPETGASPC
jgi:hypothetical protein